MKVKKEKNRKKSKFNQVFKLNKEIIKYNKVFRL